MNYTDLSGRLNPACYTVGRDNNPILALVCHNTCGPDDKNTPGQDAATAQKLSDAAASYLCSNDREVSVHWLVGAEACGAPIYLIVPESSTAYQAGGSPPAFPSTWTDPTTGQVYHGYNFNQVSIGIEVFGQVGDVLGPNQLNSLKMLVKDIVNRNQILKNPGRIVAHAELEGDRQDGKNWVAQARQWAQEGATLSTANTNPNYWPTPAYQNDDNRWVPGETGKEVNNVFGFLDFFRNNGGLPVFGFPVSGAAYLPGSATIIAQYFERARIEYHTDDKKFYLGRVGAELLDAKAQLANVASSSNQVAALQAQVAQFQNQVSQLQAQLTAALKASADKDAAIQSMQAKIDQQKALLNQQGPQIAGLNAQVAQLQAQLDSKNLEIANLGQQMSADEKAKELFNFCFALEIAESLLNVQPLSLDDKVSKTKTVVMAARRGADMTTLKY